MGERDPDWLRQGQHDPEAVAAIYDAWADGYDRDLQDWSYRAPAAVVDRLLAVDQTPGPVLDVGCGTGLVGRRLAEAGFAEVSGVDLSPKSLEIAATTGAYRDLTQLDLQSQPLPWPDDTFAALVCVGVMTYLPDVEAVVGEFCRAVAADGSVLFTQRDDLWDERGTMAAIERLAVGGRCRIEAISDPQPYLPASDELGDVPIRVVHLLAGAGSVPADTR
ncbi:MAG: class I SAM-dependent methyltransferase [Actinomycetota bacterium]